MDKQPGSDLAAASSSRPTSGSNHQTAVSTADSSYRAQAASENEHGAPGVMVKGDVGTQATNNSPEPMMIQEGTSQSERQGGEGVDQSAPSVKVAPAGEVAVRVPVDTPAGVAARDLASAKTTAALQSESDESTTDPDGNKATDRASRMIEREGEQLYQQTLLQQQLLQPGAVAVAGPNADQGYPSRIADAGTQADSTAGDDDYDIDNERASPPPEESMFHHNLVPDESLPVLVARRVETSDIENELRQRFEASELELRQRLEEYERRPIVVASLMDDHPLQDGDEETDVEQVERMDVEHVSAPKQRWRVRLCCLSLSLTAIVVVVVVLLTAVDFGGDGGASTADANDSRIPVCFESSELLFQAVDQYLSGVDELGEDNDLAQSYGWDIGNWCVSSISNFSRLFSAERNPLVLNFNADISGWNMSSAIDTSYMFHMAQSFNADLSSWDVSGVETMEAMFALASSYDQALTGWNVSKVKTMRGAFNGAFTFNKDVSSWNVSAVEDMRWLFWNASSFDQPLSGWNVSRVKTMRSMFSRATRFNHDISAWSVSQVTDMTEMFWGASSFDQKLSTWDVSNVGTMLAMFQGATAFNQDLSGWDVSNVKDMGLMFYEADAFNTDLSAWEVTSVENATGMFYSAEYFNQNISSWNVSRVRDMSYMFAGAASFNQKLSLWDVSNVESMNAMFFFALSFNQDISLWDVSSVEFMRGMFLFASSFNQDISAWNVSRVSDLSLMFSGAEKFNQDLCAWGSSLSQSINVSYMFETPSQPILDAYMDAYEWLFRGDPLCPTTADPDLAADPPGPFCHVCV